MTLHSQQSCPLPSILPSTSFRFFLGQSLPCDRKGLSSGRTINELLVGETDNLMGISIQIEHPVFHIPSVGRRGNIPWTHIHYSVGLDEVGVPGVTPIAENFFFDR